MSKKVGLHKRPNSPALFVQVTNSYFRFLISAEAIKWLGQGLDDQVWERNDYVTIVGCWQGLIKAANNFIQTNRCSGRICQASRCSGQICQASRYSVRICQTSRCSGQIYQASRCSGRICQAIRCSGRTSTRLVVFRSNLSS